jgi:hypothetical protein
MRARKAGYGMGTVSRYAARLAALEESVAPSGVPQVCVVYGDDDIDAAVSRLRAARNWPDDGAHPVKVIRVRWGKD